MSDCQVCKQLCEMHLKSGGKSLLAFWELMHHVMATDHKLDVTIQELNISEEDIKRRMEEIVRRKG
jgi:hypothetical protein